MASLLSPRKPKRIASCMWGYSLKPVKECHHLAELFQYQILGFTVYEEVRC